MVVVLSWNTRSAPRSAALRGDRCLIEDWLVTRIARARRINPGTIDVRESFVVNGLDPASSVALVGELARTLDSTLSETPIWEHPSIAVPADHVADGAAGSAAGSSTYLFPASSSTVPSAVTACAVEA